MKEVFQDSYQMVGVLELDDMGPIGFKVHRALGLGLDSCIGITRPFFFSVPYPFHACGAVYD